MVTKIAMMVAPRTFSINYDKIAEIFQIDAKLASRFKNIKLFSKYPINLEHIIFFNFNGSDFKEICFYQLSLCFRLVLAMFALRACFTV